MSGFPVESVIGRVRESLSANRPVVLQAPPGSGKTTVVPPALMDEAWLGGKKIVMLEPRRLAAVRSASFIAAQLGENPGDRVGYSIRLERKVSRATRLEIVTEGMLAQRILADPELSDTGLVIFDEFHERSLQCDLGLALALDVKRSLRPDLRIMVMSATLDTESIARHLGADTITAEGRMYPVETRYLGDVSMTAAINIALKETDGDILCFLPGAGEIKRVAEQAASVAAGSGSIAPLIVPLYGSLPKEEQDKAFCRSSRRKVVLATSIAETSLTLPGITCVIDSGLMRVPRFRPGTGMSGLVTLPLTLDRAEQRRGRAGRVRPGVCYRLWEESGNAARGKAMTPEIFNADLAPLVATVRAWDARRREDLPWLDPPPEAAWNQALAVIESLGIPAAELGEYPMHPRLAAMMIKCGRPAARLAAILEEGGASHETEIGKVRLGERQKLLMRRFERLADDADGAFSDGYMLSFAYPERVAKNRGNGTFKMASGKGCHFEPGDAMGGCEFVVAAELDDREGDARIFLAAEITKGEVESRFAAAIKSEPFCEWDRRTESVRFGVRRKLGNLTLDEKPTSTADGVEDALLEGIRQKGVDNLPCWTKSAIALKERIAFVWGWDEEKFLEVLKGFVGGIVRYRDLACVDLCAVMEFMLTDAGHSRVELDRLAPARIEVPSGSLIQVRYGGDEPRMEVRLQECFGMMDSPKVLGGRMPVVMVLLSPAQRPVQITKDLRGFWKEGYALVRKDMRGRYPKHYWPEDPFSAVPTRKTRPKNV